MSPRLLLAVLIATSSAACVQLGRPPVEERSLDRVPRPASDPASYPASYLVAKGDTLYSIAWRFDLDFKALARANGLRLPYTIYPGQHLRLAAEARTPVSTTAHPTPPRVTPEPDRPTLTWRWPTSAPVGREFGRGNSGMDFSLGVRHRVRAAAAGTVVYSGNGLGGYRYLTIIKHNDTYLSAYSLNLPPMIREGDSIKAGGVVADIKGTGRTTQILHFEIRREGEPVSPRAVIGP